MLTVLFDRVALADRHVFMCSADGDQLMINRYDGKFDTQSFLEGRTMLRSVKPDLNSALEKVE